MTQPTPEQRATDIANAAGIRSPVIWAIARDAALAAILQSDQQQAELLSDPTAVHVNMLRGGIAKPTPANIWHIYGRELLDAMPDEFRAGLQAELKTLAEAMAGALDDCQPWLPWIKRKTSDPDDIPAIEELEEDTERALTAFREWQGGRSDG